ncbi:hypothetical protein H5410_038435 [Solanum commersonii]|uniref:Uncharacterized protein n=1 Tax=Solanum commersonii TaxID=4109 RepID=A0A9J5Y8Y2_SOLCO|nr:hypothetical protein H5410_038435 [Solanum commersonii]
MTSFGSDSGKYAIQKVSEHKLLSSSSKRIVGRPQHERWKRFADVKCKRSKVTCSACRRKGHNKKTYSNYLAGKKRHIYFYFVLVVLM